MPSDVAVRHVAAGQPRRLRIRRTVRTFDRLPSSEEASAGSSYGRSRQLVVSASLSVCLHLLSGQKQRGPATGASWSVIKDAAIKAFMKEQRHPPAHLQRIFIVEC